MVPLPPVIARLATTVTLPRKTRNPSRQTTSPRQTSATPVIQRLSRHGQPQFLITPAQHPPPPDDARIVMMGVRHWANRERTYRPTNSVIAVTRVIRPSSRPEWTTPRPLGSVSHVTTGLTFSRMCKPKRHCIFRPRRNVIAVIPKALSSGRRQRWITPVQPVSAPIVTAAAS